tara:strand:+ start:231 stop:512 length:282 start_codon:yes stop_codon:yes gene_type:complete
MRGLPLSLYQVILFLSTYDIIYKYRYGSMVWKLNFVEVVVKLKIVQNFIKDGTDLVEFNPNVRNVKIIKDQVTINQMKRLDNNLKYLMSCMKN